MDFIDIFGSIKGMVFGLCVVLAGVFMGVEVVHSALQQNARTLAQIDQLERAR